MTEELMTVVASMRAKPGKEDELRAALERLVEATLTEAGCIDYVLHRGVADRTLFTFYENWTSAAHLDAHLAGPAIAAFGEVEPDLVDGGADIQRLRRIR